MSRHAVLTAAAALLLSAAGAAAEPVVPIRLNGPAANRINLVVLGDGYAAGDMLKYRDRCRSADHWPVPRGPVLDYASYFNVYRIDVASNESGVDHPERSVAKDTALGAGYNCGGIQRLICVNTSQVNAVLGRSVPANQRDIVIVVVNDAEYGGSGGAVSVASTHPSVVELMLHEMGHTVGLLADEYTDAAADVQRQRRAAEANASRLSDRSVKWNYWIDGSTPMPTAGPGDAVPGVPGLEVLSGHALPADVQLGDARARPAVRADRRRAADQAVLRLRRADRWCQPGGGHADAGGARGHRLRGDGAAADLSQPAVRWTVDGAVVGQQAAYRLFTSGMTVGSHAVVVEVSDPTSAVRSDPAGVLRGRRSWTVDVTQATSLLEGTLQRWRTR